MLTQEKVGGNTKKHKEEISTSCHLSTWDHDYAQSGAFPSF